MPVGEIVYLADESENVGRVSTAGRAFFSDSYDRIKNHSPINVSAASGGSQLESVPVGRVYLRSESGNSIMWWGGTSNDAPYSGHGFPLYGGELSIPIHVTNFSAIQIVASVSGQVVYPIGFLNGENVVLSNTVPEYPDITAPYIVSHSPVSGLSGIALNSDITINFSEVIASGSVISGVFTLTPPHDVTLYRDPTDTTNVVMRPNQNLSGETEYQATLVSGTITDIAGNICASGIVWPFTTTNAPPPPDTTPPTVSGITPVSGAQGVAIGTSPTVLFSEAMLSGTINITNIFMSTISGATSYNVSGTVSLDAGDQRTVTINPNTDLTEGQSYYINVLISGVKDLGGGNAITSGISNHIFSTNYSFTELYNINGSDESDAYDGDVIRWGLLMTSNSSALKTTPVKRVVWKLKKTGSPTGTAYVRIRNSAKNIVYEFTQTFDVSTLTTSYQDITLTDLNNTYTMVTGDSLLIEWTGGNSSNKIYYTKVSSDVYTGSKYITYDGSVWNDASQDITAVVYG